jgi:hypothetical protein
VLKKKSRLKTRNEKAAWGYFDIITANLKKILAKVPGGQSQTGSIVASYLLIKEQVDRQANITEEDIERLCEDEAAVVPANNIGQGDVKLFDPLLPRLKKVLRRKKPDVVS